MAELSFPFDIENIISYYEWPKLLYVISLNGMATV